MSDFEEYEKDKSLPPEKALEYSYNELRNIISSIMFGIDFVERIIEHENIENYPLRTSFPILKGHIMRLDRLAKHMKDYVDLYNADVSGEEN